MSSKAPTKLKIGPAIKWIRSTKEWTQAELASLLGVSVNFISQVENGRRALAESKVEELARQLGIPASFLYVLADDPGKKPVGTLQKMIKQAIARKNPVGAVSARLLD